MPTVNVKPDSVLELQAIADVMGKSKKVVVVTGAGISTNCGIPDFRSENGLYSLIQAQYDAAAKDPSAYTEEIDFRPTKRRRVTDRWTYVTVAKETGEVVTDPDLVLPTPTNSQLSRSNSTETSAPTSSISSDIEASDNSSFTSKRLRRSLRSQPSSTNESSAITSSNPPTKPPAISSSNAGSNNRSIDRVFSAEPAPEPSHRSISRTFSVEPTPESSHHSINRTSSAEPAPEAHNKTPSFKGTSELLQQQQRVTRSTSVLSEPVVEPESKAESFSRSVSLRNQKELLQVSKLQQEVTTTDPIHSSDTTHPSTVLLKKFSTKFALEKSLGNPRRSTASNPEPAPTFTPSDSSSDQQKPRCPLLEASTSSISVDSIAIETQPRIKASLQRQSSSVLTTTEESCSQSFSSSQSSSRASLPNLKGKDLFDSMIWSDAFTTSVFYRFISTLRQKVKEDVRRTTESHRFIKVLRDGGRLVRCYTQNIDSLEEREGLRTELDLGPGDRSRFSTKAKKELIQSSGDGLASGRRPLRGGVEVVQLHGSLVGLRCGICGSISSWDDEDRHETTSAGQAPECPSCESKNASRTGRGRRSLTVGRLRPDIVLYGEEHPNAHLISPLITHDLSLGPDVLLILGTSLRVHGLKVMVREFAKSVHNKGGKVVFVNNTKPSESVWGDVIDYWVEWDCDAWVSDLKERRGDIWSPLGAAKEQKTKRPSLTNEKGDPKKPSRPSATRDCRMNGVYLTFKVLESLAGILDGNGQASARYQIDCIGTKPAATGSSRRNNPKSRRHIIASNQNTSRVRKQSSTKKSRSTAVANYTTEKSSLGSSNLSPEATRQALAALSANSNRPLPATYGEFWRYGLSSNVLPGLTWPTQSINLLTHPPNTTGSPQHRSLAVNSTRDDNKMEELGRQSKDSARLDMQRVKSLKELGLRLETGHSLRIRSGLRSRRASVELPPVSIQVKAQPSPPSLANAEGTPTHDHSVAVKVTKACVECKRRKVRCNPAHHQTDPESSLPPLNHSTIDSNDMTQLSELPSSSSTSSDLQESVDAQLLREASALTSSTSSSACTDCMEQKKRCPPSHRPSLPTPPCSFSAEPKSRTKLPTPPISSDPATGTLTPTARRIKDMGNIGAVLSSPLKPTTRSSERLARRGSCS